jgi:RNA polymerase sigma-70 factor (sigma-E family)
MTDDAEFEAFARAASSQLYRTALLLTGDRSDAEDLVQVALISVHRNWHRASESPHAYAHKALTSHLVSRWRQLRRRPSPAPLAEHAATDDPYAQVALRRTLITGLRRLPRQQRAAIVLRYWNGLSEHETATALGCTPGTVKTHTARGLARLRELIPPDSWDLPTTTERTSR